jgi:DNA repair protein RadC
MGMLGTSHSRHGASGTGRPERRGAAGLCGHDQGSGLYSAYRASGRDNRSTPKPRETRQYHVLANLISTIDRQNAPHLAADLLNRFGSIARVLETPSELLTGLAGDSGELAHLLRFARETMQESFVDDMDSAPVTYDNVPFLKFVVATLGSFPDEALLASFLDRSGNHIASEILARGTSVSLEVETRTVLRAAIARDAYGLVIAHNHPGGSPGPSRSDLIATAGIKLASARLGIRLIDHFIVAGNAIYSLDKAGQL